MGTITARDLKGRDVDYTQDRILRDPVKPLSDVIEITVYVDAKKIPMSFRVQLSANLMSGQKSPDIIKAQMRRILEAEFGKVGNIT
jgi:hypothetical protein